MLETAAVYWESKIRIYGFREKAGLSLFTLTFPLERFEYWGKKIQAMAEEDGRFDLVFSQRIDKNIVQLCVLFEEKSGSLHRRQVESAVKKEAETSLTLDFPVEMISFHGPHFQDRYGIASVAFDALEQANITLLASGCTGTSIYIVLPKNFARSAIEHLTEFFVIPQADHPVK